MDIKYLMLLVLSFFIFGCNFPEENTCDFSRRISINTELFPLQEEYSIGDSVSYKIEFPKEIFDSTKQELIDVSDWGLVLHMSFIEFTEEDHSRANDLFEFHVKSGVMVRTPLSDGYDFLHFNFDDDGDSMIFESSIVFKSEGLFVFYLWYFLDVITLDECPNRQVYLTFELNDHAYNSYDLINNSDVREMLTRHELSDQGGFVFRVVE